MEEGRVPRRDKKIKSWARNSNSCALEILRSGEVGMGLAGFDVST